LHAARLCMAPACSQPMPFHAVHLHGVGVHWADTGTRHAHACSTRLLHPPPAPGGSTHGLRTQAPSAYHMSTAHAPRWGRRAENGPPGRSCHGPKPAEGASSLGCPHWLHGPPFATPTPTLDCPTAGLHNVPSMGAGDPRTGEQRSFKAVNIAESVVSGTCLPPPTTPRPTATTLGSARPRPTHRCRNGAKRWRRQGAAPPKPPQLDM